MDLNEIRQQIDSVDNEIVALLEERMKLVTRVSAYKQRTAKMIRREIMETYSNEEIRGLNGFFLTKSELDIDTAGLEKEIEDIMKHSRTYQASKLEEK